MKKEVTKDLKDEKKNTDKKRKAYIAEGKKVKKEKKRINIFKEIVKYFKGVGKEVKRIKWTTGKELIKYSIASIAFVVFFGIYFYAVDWIALLVRSLAS